MVLKGVRSMVPVPGPEDTHTFTEGFRSPRTCDCARNIWGQVRRCTLPSRCVCVSITPLAVSMDSEVKGLATHISTTSGTFFFLDLDGRHTGRNAKPIHPPPLSLLRPLAGTACIQQHRPALMFHQCAVKHMFCHSAHVQEA